MRTIHPPPRTRKRFFTALFVFVPIAPAFLLPQRTLEEPKMEIVEAEVSGGEAALGMRIKGDAAARAPEKCCGKDSTPRSRERSMMVRSRKVQEIKAEFLRTRGLGERLFYMTF